MPDQEKYHAYLFSPQWARKRRLIFERCAGVCERCNVADAEEVHHLTYRNLYDEPLSDLQGLCAPCHRFISKKSDLDPCDYGDNWIDLYIARLGEI